MALLTTCKNGHSYTVADMYVDWPQGAPHCSICYEQWRNTKVAVSVNAVSKSNLSGLTSINFSIGETKPATLDQLIVGFALQVAQFAARTTNLTDDEILSAINEAGNILAKATIK